MSIMCLMALALIGQEPAKDLPPSLQWQWAAEVKAEPIKLGADGVEIVTIRMKIKPKFYVLATPQPDEIFHPAEMKLVIKAKDPKTKFEAKYPKGIDVVEGNVRWTKYEGDIVITAMVRRAKGDEGPLECVLRFRPMRSSGGP